MSLPELPPEQPPTCSFCLKLRPRWTYGDGWLACTRCATVIDRGDVDTLANVCAESGLSRMGIPAQTRDVEDYARVLREKYDKLVPTLGERRRAVPAENLN